MRNASSVASATSSGVPNRVAVADRHVARDLASVSGRRNALRPNVLMVVVRQPAAAGSQPMNLTFWVGWP